jgi:hypothetical protein
MESQQLQQQPQPQQQQAKTINIQAEAAAKGIQKPAADTRQKTEDVTATKGYTFQSFGLSKDVLLVSLTSLTIFLRVSMRKVLSRRRRFRRRRSLWR